MARVHLYIHPDDFDAYRSGEEAGAMLIPNNDSIHIDVDDREVTELAYPMVTIKRRT
jgi:hypothetical protein